MKGVDFLDTNILVYAVDAGAAASKSRIAKDIVLDAVSSQSAVVSFQVVQEALHVVTRKARSVASETDADAFAANVLFPLWKVQPSEALYRKAVGIQISHGFAFYDSLIVAAALAAKCRRLLTEDLQHGQRIEGLRVENPFLA